MLITLDTRDVTMDGVVATRSFSLELGGHLMGILSGLYSDIPYAIVREYMTNMLDGYADLPPTTPHISPRVLLPNVLAPYIEFSDFGVGMDFDTVWEVFTTYGASTKRGTNEQVGGLGIGAKTAFCYPHADQWTVESRHDGQRHVFAATKDQQGVPLMVHMTSDASDAPSGVTVRIPVAQSDFGLFHIAVAKMVPHFPMPVEIVGWDTKYGALPTVRDSEYTGTGWALDLRSGYSNMTNCTLVMGNIPYPVSLVTAGLPYGADKGIELRLTVPIGAVDITPSREALKYTERTKLALQRVYANFSQEFSAQVTTEVASASTQWEALSALYRFDGVEGVTQALTDVTWRGVKLSLTDGLRVRVDDVTARFGADVTVWVYSNTDGRSVAVKRNLWGWGDRSFSPAKKMSQMVILDDLVRPGIVRRVSEEMGQHINGDRYRKALTVVVKGTTVTEELLQECFGGMPVVRASTLFDSYVKGAATVKRPATMKLLAKSEYGRRPGELRFDPYTADLPETVYYTLLDGHDCEWGTAGYADTMLKRAVNIGLVPKHTQLFGVPKSLAKKIPATWIHLRTLLRREVSLRRRAMRDAVAEKAALREVFGERANITSVKSLRTLVGDPRHGQIPALVAVADIFWAETRAHAMDPWIQAAHSLSIPLTTCGTDVHSSADRERDIRSTLRAARLALPSLGYMLLPSRDASNLTRFFNAALAQ